MLSTAFLTLVLIVALGLAFDFINGFHDTANAIATSVATRVLSPGQAVLMAAVLNFIGALSGTAVAGTIGKGILPVEGVSSSIVIAALLSAIAWNLITWYYGIPSSSSHALVFSLTGAGIGGLGWDQIQTEGLNKVLQGLLFSPVLGFLGAFLLMTALLWSFGRMRPRAVSSIFGRLQIVSAAYMAYGHGHNDAQKTMGVITMALASYYGWSGSEWAVPTWVVMSAAIAMALGTGIGGWRIVKTMGLKVVELRPIHGFAAETAAATVIQGASVLGIPVSTTHVISTSILGVGATKRLSAVRWGVAGRIVLAWIITIPVCLLLGWVIYSAIDFLGGLF